ncbi:MAG: aminoglycoside phosphotransferase family protein [Deferrisomatales bacterium]
MIPSPAALAGLLPRGDLPLSVAPLHGDGSARRFFRVRGEGHTYVLLEGQDPAENEAYVRIARHLGDRGIRVPRVRGADESRGWILLEDLGDRSLFAALREPGADPFALYEPVLELLARMQVRGAEGFRLETGFAPAPYGTDLMVEGEGLYFAREVARGFLGLVVPDAFRGDLERLAALGASAPGGFFLHRDFQSRNIQLTPEGPALLDFQGARPGPLAYDAAALILDPYVDNPPALRTRLLERYRGCLVRLGASSAWTEDGRYALGAFRLLQALGAFGKLGGRLGKPGFLEHVGAALRLLGEHLGERGKREFPVLWGLVDRCACVWASREPLRGRGGA